MSFDPNGLDLDPSLYAPSEEEISFFKAETGIKTDEELKEHILKIQKEAWDVMHYVCIRIFGFTKLRVRGLPGYSHLLYLAKERPGAIFLDYACAFGVDTRAAIADGFPIENVVASDIQRPFWDIGHKLFKSTPETFPVPFIQGDIFDPLFIAPAEAHYTPPTTPRPIPSTLTSLTPLQGHVSAIHAALFFHLFQEEGQLKAAHALASLLSPEPGSIIFGSHGGAPVAGLRSTPNVRGDYIYCHSPESWKELWDGVVFKKGTVEVTAELKDGTGMVKNEKLLGPAANEAKKMLFWTVKRL